MKNRIMGNRNQKKKYKLAVLDTHPIPYKVPIFRRLDNHPKIDLMLYFCSDYQVNMDYDPGFRTKIKWNISLLDLNHKFLRNYNPSKNIFPPKGLINIGIINELFREKYDAILIHGYSYITSLLAFFGAWLSRTPIFFRTEADTTKKEPLIKCFLKKIFFIPLFKLVDAFLYNYTLNASFYRTYSIPKKKLFFFPCAVENDFFQEEAKRLLSRKNSIKKRLGLPTNLPIILSSGKLLSRKKLMDLIKAYEQISNKVKASLVFVGDGPESDNLKGYVKKKRLKNVFFMGFKNRYKLSPFYVIADVFVLPSAYDPSPKAMNEAMNFGLPIITTNKVGTAYDLVKNGVNGFVHKVGDVNALSDYLVKILKNPGIRKRMGKKSLEIVSKWTFDRDVKGVIEALEYVKRKDE